MWGGVTLLSPRAEAGCPGSYASAACTDPYDSSADVCFLDGSNKQIVCDMGNATTSGALTIVEDYDATSDFEAWGDLDGNTFCCEVAEPTGCTGCSIETIVIFGSLHDDSINLSYNDGGTLRHLQPNKAAHLDAWVFGGDDEDTIHGSGYVGTTGAGYAENLCGMGAGDTINGHPGDDYIYGDCPADHGFIVPSSTDSGQADLGDTLTGDYGDDTILGYDAADTIYGGPGDDYIEGNDGADDIEGGQDIDTIHGGDGPDGIDGGLGDDFLYGDDGPDAVCGGPGEDEVHGTNPITSSDSDADKLWPGNTTGDTVDSCDLTDGDAYQSGADKGSNTCTATLTTKPSGCP